MSVIFCDSNCELWYDKIDELGLKVISMPYTITDTEYYYDNGRATKFKEFYDKVRNGEMPITSALNATNYIEIFEPYFKQNEEILYISFSSEMSGTFQFMDMAIKELSEKYPKAKFQRFDTKSISMGAGLQVYLAAKYFNQGHSIEETVKYLEVVTNKVRTLFIVEDLNHLKRGGRLTSTSAFVGTLMSIKPILSITEEGKLEVIEKKKGIKKAIKHIVSVFGETYKEFDNCPVYIIDADNKAGADMIESLIKMINKDIEVVRQSVGPTIGTHCGPGTLGLLFPSDARF